MRVSTTRRPRLVSPPYLVTAADSSPFVNQAEEHRWSLTVHHCQGRLDGLAEISEL